MSSRKTLMVAPPPTCGRTVGFISTLMHQAATLIHVGGQSILHVCAKPCLVIRMNQPWSLEPLVCSQHCAWHMDTQVWVSMCAGWYTSTRGTSVGRPHKLNSDCPIASFLTVSLQQRSAHVFREQLQQALCAVCIICGWRKKIVCMTCLCPSYFTFTHPCESYKCLPWAVTRSM